MGLGLGSGFELQEIDDVITLEWPRLFILISVIIMIFIFNIDRIGLHHSTREECGKRSFTREITHIDSRYQTFRFK